MKLKFVMLFLVATIVSSSCVSMLVWIPEASVLNQRLKDIGAQHFSDFMDIGEELPCGVYKICDVVEKVDTALKVYDRHMQNPAISRLMRMRRPDVIKVFFQDSPEALALLKKQGVLE